VVRKRPLLICWCWVSSFGLTVLLVCIHMFCVSFCALQQSYLFLVYYTILHSWIRLFDNCVLVWCLAYGRLAMRGLCLTLLGAVMISCGLVGKYIYYCIVYCWWQLVQDGTREIMLTVGFCQCVVSVSGALFQLQLQVIHVTKVVQDRLHSL